MSLSASRVMRSTRKENIWTRPPLAGSTPRPGRIHHGCSKILRTQSRPQRSHEHHACKPDDKTLSNDVLFHREEEGQQVQDVFDTRSDASDDPDLLFTWDTEQSLLYDLMEEGESDQDRLDLLVDSLQAPLDAKRAELRQEIAQTFVPAMRHVHGLHKVLSERVDVTYGKGLKFFNDACKDLEAATLAEYDEIVDAYEKTRANIANLMEQLKAEYTLRDQLWLELERKMNEIADSAITEVQDTPAQVERTIAKLEKYSQTMEKDGKESNIFSEKHIKDLINKLHV
ncbi:hypothetical protein H1R20_g2188, partial [Candolleomyces eurysporus]